VRGRRRMRPTDFCFPSLCRRAPAPRRFPICVRFYPTASGGKDASRHPLPASVGRAPCFDAGRFLPRAEAHDRTSDTPSLTELSRERDALFLRRTLSLPASLDRFCRLPRDGMTAPSIRGAFHRRVPEPSTRALFPAPSRDSCVPRSRGFAHRDPVLDALSLAAAPASRFRDRRRPSAR
jgi:hypothetical protein